MSEAEEFFTELLFGEGALFGFLLIICIIILVSAYEKKSAIVLTPFSIVLGITYFLNVAADSLFMWLAIIQIIVIPAFLLFRLVKD